MTKSKSSTRRQPVKNAAIPATARIDQLTDDVVLSWFAASGAPTPPAAALGEIRRRLYLIAMEMDERANTTPWPGFVSEATVKAAANLLRQLTKDINRAEQTQKTNAGHWETVTIQGVAISKLEQVSMAVESLEGGRVERITAHYWARSIAHALNAMRLFGYEFPASKNARHPRCQFIASALAALGINVADTWVEAALKKKRGGQKKPLKMTLTTNSDAAVNNGH